MIDEKVIYAVLIYIGAVSLIAVVLTVMDKYFAIKHRWRIPEKTLILFGLIGGAAAEYAVMKMIRHKTLHKKFMIGLPLIIAAHVIIIAAIEIYIHLPH